MVGARGGRVDRRAPGLPPDLLDNPEGDDGVQVQDDEAEVVPDVGGTDEDRR